MTDNARKLQDRYCLRYAGGIYWLLDCEQDGLPYREPIPMNEVGADICKLMIQGKTEAEIIECICAEYDADEETVRQDVEYFKQQLEIKFAG